MGYTLPSASDAADEARELMARKDAIEAEIAAQGEILHANDATMQTPLVDREGFPRADMDIWAVRTARVRIIELRNDLEAVRDALASVLARVYERKSDASAADADKGASVKKEMSPFAKVNSVAPGSPASDAGMQRDDMILKFGHLTHEHFNAPGASLQPLAEVVSANEDKPISIIVRRGQISMALRLTPRQGWGGRGMLGCHILPYSAIE